MRPEYKRFIEANVPSPDDNPLEHGASIMPAPPDDKRKKKKKFIPPWPWWPGIDWPPRGGGGKEGDGGGGGEGRIPPRAGYKQCYNGYDPCDLCIANINAGDIPINQPFPSGDQSPPFHDGCRCDCTITDTDGQQYYARYGGTTPVPDYGALSGGASS